MNKKLAKLLTFYIFPKKVRKQARSFLISLNFQEMLMSPVYLLKILVSRHARADVYVMELNPFHVECLYSIYAYLQNTNRDCVIFTTPKNIQLGLFPKQTKIFPIYPGVVRFLDRIGFFYHSKLIFAGSYFIWFSQKNIECFLSNYIKRGRNLICLDHAPEMHNPIHSLHKNVYQLVLADFLQKIYNMPVIYPIIFPCPQKPKSADNNKFISVGVIGDPARRDMDSYMEWLNKNPTAHSDIISATIFPGWRERLNRLQNISVYERASFTQLFESCKKATFIPFLIHGDDLGYYNHAISGNLNLALGFTIIPIIDARLAKLYGFDDKHAIIYKGQKEFESAMTRAANMTDNEIKSKQEALKQMYTEYLIKSQLEIDKFL